MEQKVILLFVICHGVILSLMKGVNSEAVVQLENTQIWGKETTFENIGVRQFLGVPYAERPVGNLRFKKTVPLASFPEQFEAYYPGPACRQYTDAPYPWYMNDDEKSEDCLYLNIWAPADANPQNLKPVLVWVHSGNHKFGSNSIDYYSGEPLAALGDIIVMTFNYRLGMFGFLSSHTNDAPGNAGLWDMREALMWVHKYIQYFGGDPFQITFGGHSSSATDVGYFTLNDDTQELIDKLILQSGSPVNFQTDYRKRNEDLGIKIAKTVGCANDDQTKLDSSIIQCLKDVGADELEQAEYKSTPNSPASFHPVTGDEFLPENPRKSTLEGKFTCKTLLIGNTRDEGSVILPLLDTKSFGFHGEKTYQVTGDTVTKILNIILGSFPDLSALPAIPNLQDLPSQVTPAVKVNPLLPDPKSAMTAAVPVDKLSDGLPNIGSLLANNILGDATSNPDCMRRQLHNAVGDVVLLCPTRYFAEKCAEQANDVYYYYFIHRTSNSPFAPWMGATHFSEIAFVFGKPLRNPDGYTEEEKELSRQMIHFWSNFVKTGKPDPSWPKYTKDDPIYKVLGGKNGTKPYGKGPHKTNCNLLRPAYEML